MHLYSVYNPLGQAVMRQFALAWTHNSIILHTKITGAHFAFLLVQAALAALIGSSASYAYLILLQRRVDAVLPTDSVPIWDAEDNVEGFARPFAIGAAAYRCVLTHPDLMLS